MIIRCYGARGSIPVSGEAYLRYGGDTTCLEIRTKNDEIIILDAGTGIRRLGKELLKEERFEYNLLFTHSHWDHILGFPFFKPIYREETEIHLIGCPTTQGNIKTLLSRTMTAPFFPVPFDKMRAKIRYSNDCQFQFNLDTIEITPIQLSHPNVGMGYKFEESGKTFVFLTDNELGYVHRNGRTFDDYVAFSGGADLLIHDAQFTPEECQHKRTWGHSSFTEALDLAIAAQVKRFGLFHHNPDRHDGSVDDMVQQCRRITESKNIDMDCFALKPGMELIL